MHKAIRIALSLGICIILFSALMAAQSGGNNSVKGDSKEHHSRIGKVAFWRHHKTNDTKAKSQSPSKQDSAKTSQVKPASSKQVAGKKDQKQQPSPSHAANKPKTQASSTKGSAKTSQVKAASTRQAATKKNPKQQQSPSHAAGKSNAQASSTKNPAKTSQTKSASTKQASTKPADSKEDQKQEQPSASGK